MVLHIIRADILFITQLAKYPCVLYVKPSIKIFSISSLAFLQKFSHLPFAHNFHFHFVAFSRHNVSLFFYLPIQLYSTKLKTMGCEKAFPFRTPKTRNLGKMKGASRYGLMVRHFHSCARMAKLFVLLEQFS